MDVHLKKFVDLLVKIDDTKEMKKFLKVILTPAELESIPKRLEIFKLLREGMSQHKIAKKLGVGIATVTRGSKELQNSNWWRDYSSSTYSSF